MFLLRNFYSSKRLIYDAHGQIASPADVGDWTEDAVIKIKGIRISHDRLQVGANRIRVFAKSKSELGLVQSTEAVSIEIRLEPQLRNVNDIDAILSRVFLAPGNRLSDLVPDYWKPCVKVALTESDDPQFHGCHFSGELAALTGVGSYAKDDPAMSVALSGADIVHMGPDNKLHHFEKGLSPARVTYQHIPEFSEAARQAKFQGIVILGLIVDSLGSPKSIHVIGPLGFGLDAKAVSAVEGWKFTPAEKDGQPVAMEMAVETDFHLY